MKTLSTLSEIDQISPKKDDVEVYKYQNKWIIHNFYREKLINEKLKECQQFKARLDEMCLGEHKKETYEPIDMNKVYHEKKWYEYKSVIIGGFVATFSIGALLGYFIAR